ncbi:fMet-Leu-Phe receptor [Biomphalaria glabrata]|uniref:G-protein coupled receptors family 1 profile domain-containing protein n=1 Tax=Biomphalaria glabrata TaxID=6526 RepID=A0A2C9LQL7_BIOGL|nr:fMet-Leu-Phe receptor [Biomphalaria glabrata]
MAGNISVRLETIDNILSDEQYTITEGTLCLVRGTLACLGVAANIVNVKTFMAMGLKDAMTICFLSLSLSDLGYLLTVICRAASFAFMTAESLSQFCVWFPVEPYGVYIYFGHAGRIPYIMSNITTTFLAVVRCLCVAKPLLFKNMFGKRITLIVLTVSVTFSVVSYLPVLVYMGMTSQNVPGSNVTRPTLWISPKREEVKDVVWAMRDAFVPFASQVIILICLLVLTSRLRSAYIFRQKLTIRGLVPERPKSTDRLESGSGVLCTEIKGLGGKDLQVVQQVVLISVVYVFCNTPTILVNFAGVIEPQFSIEKLYKNLYLTVTGVKHLCQTINASFNIFIYSRYNSKYRKTLLSN